MANHLAIGLVIGASLAANFKTAFAGANASLQKLGQAATGVALDLCGESLGCYRLMDKATRTVLRSRVEGEHPAIVIAYNFKAMVIVVSKPR